MNLRTLTHRELARYATIDWDSEKGLPVEMQRELLRRFSVIADFDEHPYIDPKQQKLPL